MSSTNWRQSIRQNSVRTTIVIGLFLLIYSSVGLLIDLYLLSGRYPHVPMAEFINAFVHGQLIPYATFGLFGVAILSLWVSFFFHNQLMLLGTEYVEITQQTSSAAARQLYNIIEELKIAAGLAYMPKVYIINAPYMNAFASGFSEKSAMVAITEGLMSKLTRAELTAVMAHEVSHIRHLDIKLTLTASLLTNLTLMIVDIFFYQLLFARNDNESERNRGPIVTIVMILRYCLPIINFLLLMYLSRTRELMADAGCVELTRDNTPLATALIKIHDNYSANAQNPTYSQTPHENVRRESYFYDPMQAGLSGTAAINDLFSTHPSLEKRLAALGYVK